MSDSIGDVSGDNSIASLWHDHLKELLNSVQNTQHKPDVGDKVSMWKYSGDIRVSVIEMKRIVEGLKKGKAAGYDSLSAEHVKYAGSRLLLLLWISFSSMMIHGHLPHGLMDTIIVPIVKNKAGDLNSRNNYKPIALTTILSKVFEHLLLRRGQDKLTTHDNQIGRAHV